MQCSKQRRRPGNELGVLLAPQQAAEVVMRGPHHLRQETQAEGQTRAEQEQAVE